MARKSDTFTIVDVAEMAGVSTATVSRALNGSGAVASKTLQRVLDAARELNCYPTASGTLRHASGKPSKQILMLGPKIGNPFYSAVIEGVHDAAYQNGYTLSVMQAMPSDASRLNMALAMLQNHSIDGLIFHGYTMHRHKELLDSLPDTAPIVMCSEFSPELNRFLYVGIDDEAAAAAAVNYIISTRRERIAFINRDFSCNYAIDRERGYRKAMENAGLPVNEDWVFHLNTVDHNIAFASVSEILSKESLPDAIFAVSDQYAIGALKAAKKFGLSVPQDIAVMGFDNTYLATITDPMLTTVHQPQQDMGETAFYLLKDRIDNPSGVPKQIFLETELVVREST